MAPLFSIDALSFDVHSMCLGDIGTVQSRKRMGSILTTEPRVNITPVAQIWRYNGTITVI